MSEEKQKKPFKDSTVGKILLGLVPGVAKVASSVLPDRGVLGVLKNIIDTDPDLSEE